MIKERKAIKHALNALLLVFLFRRSANRLRLLREPSFSGGPSTKADQLSPICSRGLQLYSHLFALSAVRFPIALVRLLKLMGAKLILNQNGVYYPAWFAGDHSKENAYLRKLFLLSDHIFFQSAFAERSFYAWVGADLKGLRETEILYNPVDLSRFRLAPPRPMPSSSSPLKVVFFQDAHQRNSAYWERAFEIIPALDNALLPLNLELEILFMGAASAGWSNEIRRRIEKITPSLSRKSKIHWHPNPTHSEIPALLSNQHILIHLVSNDVCPNKVLEAMAAGCFVIGPENGGTSELLGSTGYVMHMPFTWEISFPAVAEVIAGTHLYLKNPGKNHQLSLERAKNFSLEAWHERILTLVNRI